MGIGEQFEFEKDVIEKLTPLSEKETLLDIDEAFIIDDYAGGNVDDAYYRGVSDGETFLAREILQVLQGES
jgi:hypothetical protein